MDQDKVTYVLLDLAGNVEEEKQMTPDEAKKRNEYLHEKESRFLRWAAIINCTWIR